MENFNLLTINGVNEGVITFESTQTGIKKGESINGQPVSFEVYSDANAGFLTMIFPASNNAYKMPCNNNETVEFQGNFYNDATGLLSNICDFFKKGGGGTPTTPDLDQVLTAGNFTGQEAIFIDGGKRVKIYGSAVRGENNTPGSTNKIDLTFEVPTDIPGTGTKTVNIKNRSGNVQLENEEVFLIDLAAAGGTFQPQYPGIYLITALSGSPNNIILDNFFTLNPEGTGFKVIGEAGIDISVITFSGTGINVYPAANPATTTSCTLEKVNGNAYFTAGT